MGEERQDTIDVDQVHTITDCAVLYGSQTLYTRTCLKSLQTLTPIVPVWALVVRPKRTKSSLQGLPQKTHLWIYYTRYPARCQEKS